jgi:hypothetical protein
MPQPADRAPRPTRRPALLGGVVGLAFLCAPQATACDSTCCLLLTRGTSGLMGRGGLQIDVSYRYTDMSRRLEGRSRTGTVIRPKVLIEKGEVIPGYHEDLTGSEAFLHLDVAYGLRPATTAFVSAPLLGQRSYQIGHGGVQTRYNVRGIGDPVVGVRQALARSPGRILVASLGVELPLGRTDTIDQYDATILDPTLQPGTGSGDLIAALQWSTTAPGRTEFALSGTYQANTTNEHGYRFGNQVIAAATLSRPMGAVVPSLQVKLFDQGRSRFAGSELSSTGSTLVYLNAGLRYRSSEGVSLYGHVLVPAYRRVNDAQLAARFSVLFGLAKAF